VGFGKQALDEQREWCDAILKSKDAVIGELQLEIRHKDDEYVKALVQYKKDVGMDCSLSYGAFADTSSNFRSSSADHE
jgi:hypothetical protein